jgi:LmbE family N-acetylglucosaminyl deacetylase
VLRDEAVDVLTIYDDHGVYGHPDHIQVYSVGRRAAELVGLSPERVLCSTMNRDVLRERWLAEAEAARRLAEERTDPDRPDPDRPDPESNDFDIDTFGLPDADITHAVDVRSVIERKRRSMRAHRSQIAEDGFLLSEPAKFEEAFGIEWFASLGARRVQGAPFRGRLLEAG